METIHIYTRKITLEELPKAERFVDKKYEAMELKLQDLEQLSIQGPTLFLIRLVEETYESEAHRQWVMEKQEKLFRFFKSIDSVRYNVSVLFFVSSKDFNLAYRILDVHADGMILEPATKEEIRHKLDFCVKKLESRSMEAVNRKRLEEHEFLSRQRVMERMVEQFMDRPQEMEFLREELNKRYNTNFGPKNYQGIVISVNQFELYTKDSQFTRDISRLVMWRLSSAREVILDKKEPYGLVVFVNYPDGYSVLQYKSQLEQLRLDINDLSGLYGDFEFAIGVGPVVKGISELKESLRQAAYSQEFRMLYKDRIYYASEVLKDDWPVTKFLPEQSMKELCRYVFMGDVERIHAWYQHFFKEVEPRFAQYPPAYAKFCWQMYCYIKAMAKQRKVPMFPDVKFFALQYRFDGHKRMEETEKLLQEITHLIQSEIPSDKKLAQEAMAYMKVHFSEPISLEAIAETCGVSTSYFSRKFKEQTGENYIDVLTEIRMKEAMRLLSETDDSIDEILEKLCYSDDKHFRNLFVSYTGMLPMVYRKTYRQKEKG